MKREQNIKEIRQYTLRFLRTTAAECGYVKMSGTASDHEKWKKSGCLDVVIPTSNKEVNRMLGKRLYKQMINNI